MLTVESNIPDPPEAKFTPFSPFILWWPILLATERKGGGLLLKPICIAEYMVHKLEKSDIYILICAIINLRTEICI